MVDATSPGDVVALFALERERLLEDLERLGDDEWRRASPCPGWTVRDLVSHLVGVSLGVLSRQRDGYEGTPEATDLGESEFVTWLDAFMQQWVHAARGLSPRVLVELLEWSGPPIVATFARQDPSARTAHVEWAGPDPVPAWLHQVRELSEFWIHRQQIRLVTDRAVDRRADVLAPVLSGLRWAYPYRLGSVVRPTGSTVVISVTGDVSATWHLVATEDGWTYTDPAGPVVAALALDTDEAWRLLSNNLDLEGRQRIRVRGDAEIGRVLATTIAIIGAPPS